MDNSAKCILAERWIMELPTFQHQQQQLLTQFTLQTPLSRLYLGNFLRAWYDDSNVFNPGNFKKFTKDYKFRFMDFSIVDQDTIYKIAFHEGPSATEPSGKTWFRINMKDMAIVEYQFARGNKDMLLYKTFVKFQKSGDRYYPVFIQVTQPRYMINKSENDNEYDIETYWFEGPDLKNTKSKSGILVDRSRYLLPKNIPNKKTDWENCAICKEHPVDTEALRLLRELEK